MDKILLLLLIVLLPLGIVVSRQVFDPDQGSIEEERAESLAQIEALLDELASSEQAGQEPATQIENSIELESIAFASSSGILSIKGRNAQPSMLVRVMLVEFQKESQATQNSAVANVKAIGKPVVLQAIEPLTDGSFSYEYLPNISSGIIDVTVEQDGFSFTAGYDMDSNRIEYQSM